MKRRLTLKLLFSIPFFAILPSLQAVAQAVKMKMLDENDPMGKAMQYKADASKASNLRTDKKAFCHNCAKYNVCMDGDTDCKPLDAKALKTANAAPCQIFKGSLVTKEGWCLSWQAKG